MRSLIRFEIIERIIEMVEMVETIGSLLRIRSREVTMEKTARTIGLEGGRT